MSETFDELLKRYQANRLRAEAAEKQLAECVAAHQEKNAQVEEAEEDARLLAEALGIAREAMWCVLRFYNQGEGGRCELECQWCCAVGTMEEFIHMDGCEFPEQMAQVQAALERYYGLPYKPPRGL